jgi:hypothetical protein
MPEVLIDESTGELLPQNVMAKVETAPAITIDISDVALYHTEPQKLVDIISAQASFAVFDICSKKGRDACKAHAANIIRCIAPAANESKRMAAELKAIEDKRLFDEAVAKQAETLRLSIEAELTRKAEAEQTEKLRAEIVKVRAEVVAKMAEERRMDQAKIDAKAEMDKEDYDFEMASQHDADKRQVLDGDIDNPSVVFSDENERHIIPVEPNNVDFTMQGMEVREIIDRPTDDEIIKALAFYFGKGEAEVVSWLKNMDLGAL